MYIMIFDTETTNLERPFCYNIGYTVLDTETNTVVLEKDYVVEQIWHNVPLFSSAYYADKRPIYVSRMKARKTIMKKYGYIMQDMIKDINKYDICAAYAYNSSFDEKVFNFNCDWFKCINPFDNIPIFDIRGYVHNKIAFTAEYQSFCETNQFFTESGNYSTTAEALFRYISKQLDFVEEHTALSDSKIETEILKYCVSLGAVYNKEYKVYRSVPRKVDKTMNIYINGELESVYTYSKRINKGNDIYLKD